ncbi:hypothetical protein Dsin_024536 [Dipteronia sinensis]|uniref:Uncharacterized protein n=1 Tax=Dipteronia sinensis TaxID=43782 RepID=A0AAD9ZUD5_9ROSI|nr:hypothetical protein Dsin_024536 [Dipteronia sinensis]
MFTLLTQTSWRIPRPPLHLRKRKNYPLSDDEGGKIKLRLSGRNTSIGTGFTNILDSSLSMSTGESSGTVDQVEGAVWIGRDGVDLVSMVIGLTLSLRKEFNCIPDSTAIRETLAKIHYEYSVPKDIILSLPIKGFTAYTPFSKGQQAIHVSSFCCGLWLPLHPTLRHALHVFQVAPIQMSPVSWLNLVYFLVTCA